MTPEPAEETSDPAGKPWWRRWLVDPLVAQLKQGTSRSKIAWTIATGITLGIFPIPGTRAWICLLAGAVFRLNQPLLHTSKSLVYPLHLVLLIPFIQAGQWIFGREPLPLDLSGIKEMMAAGILPFLKESGWMLLRAAVAWLIAAPFLLLALRAAVAPPIARLARRASAP